MNEGKNRIGIDIGGTSIKAGLINPENGEVIEYRETPTPSNPEIGLSEIASLLDGWLTNSNSCVGVIAPGPLDVKEGIILDPPNLKGWHQYPFVKRFQEAFRKNCVFENDANGAALGEYYAGAAIGTKSMVYVTISTGIGAGIVFDGQLLSGAQGIAGEVGNMIISNEGPAERNLNVGSWETLASGTAMKKKVYDLYSSEGGAKELLSRVEKGEREATIIFEKWMGDLASGIANLVHIINPEMIVLGGGVMKGREVILPKLRAEVNNKVYESLKDKVDIRAAVLEDKVGVIGASYLPIVRGL